MPLNINPKVINDFIAAHQTTSSQARAAEPKVYLLSEKGTAGDVSYKLGDKLDVDIYTYAGDRLKEIGESLKTETDSGKRTMLLKIAALIEKDFENAAVDPKKVKINQIKIKVLQEKLHNMREEAIPKLGDQIPQADVNRRISEHRTVQPAKVRAYDAVQLTGIAEKRLDDWLKANGAREFQGKTPAQVAIIKAKMKEQFVSEVYREKMGDNIRDGFFDPAIIPKEMNMILGSLEPMPTSIADHAALNHLLFNEVDKHKKHLTHHQVNYIKHDVEKTMHLYLKAYPDKNLHDAFALGRDLVRLAVYQEIFDKGSFTGSDHGSQHIHGNIGGTDHLHSHGMEEGVDYNVKDQFMEHLIHFNHDIGYTTGLSSQSFSCCKDHPFIGAAMVDANRGYYEHFLDKESVDILRDGVLLHAIAIPNLTPDTILVAGMHPGMIRSVTSISDACALTYDRKTQEFWEQPESLLALARLKVFLTDYPQYIDKFSSSGKNLWADPTLDKNNLMDAHAVDIFTGIRAQLFEAVEHYEMPGRTREQIETRRNLFRQAIEQQFNAFTAQTTLGQYGGTLENVYSVKNTSGVVGDPKYIPGFDMSPSIMYGVLRDLFGEDQAQQSFKKLVDEFGGNIKDLSKEIEIMGKAVTGGAHPQPKQIQSGVAMFQILPTTHARAIPSVEIGLQTENRHNHRHSHHKHMAEKELNLRGVVDHIQDVYASEVISRSDKVGIIKQLKTYRTALAGGSKQKFDVFIKNEVMRKMNMQSKNFDQASTDLGNLSKLVELGPFEEIAQADAAVAKAYESLTNRIKMTAPYNTIVPENVMKKYFEDLGQVKGVLDKPTVGILELNKYNAEFIKGIKKSNPGADPAAIQTIEDSLNTIAKEITKPGNPGTLIASSERRYQNIENALKITLSSSSEHEFLFGFGAAPKEQVVTSMFRDLKGSAI